MAYFFRIHTSDVQGDNNVSGWQETSLIGNDNTGIQTILDAVDQLPSSGKIGTSIPTPFARIYLFRAAFQAVVNSKNSSSKCSKSYEQLVSDCLDLLQFLFEKGNDPDIKLYDVNISLLVKSLHKSQYEQEKILGDSLEIESNGEFENTSITLIEYKGILLGGTSPFTVVYTSPNLRREIRERGLEAEFTSNDKKPFWSGQNLSLEQRNADFRTYMTRLHNRFINPEIGKLDFFQYIATAKMPDCDITKEQYDQLYPVISNESGTLKTDNWSISYSNIPPDMKNSDFLMRPTKTCEHAPLVLPAVFTGTAGSRWTYVDSEWDPQTRIIDVDCNSEINTRRLPKNGADSSHESSLRYPWVSNCDFFYDNLFDLEYNVNTDKFYAPSFVGNGRTKPFTFLLPIKRTWFRYFTVEDLKNCLKISRWTDESIVFELSVPLVSNKGKIVLSREYNKSASSDYRWITMSTPVDLGIFPFYKIDNSADSLNADCRGCTRNEYSIYLFDAAGNSKNDSLSPKLTFLNVEDKSEANSIRQLTVESKVRTCNIAGKSTIYDIRYNKKSDNPITRFDVIEFSSLEKASDGATIIPEFKKVNSTQDPQNQAIFAIDFGTSNTHISYWDNAKKCARPFEITAEEQQMVLLNKPIADEKNVIQYRFPKAFGRAHQFNNFLREFVPQIIGDSGIEKAVEYPVKTAFLENPRTITDNILFISGNIGYDIDNEDVQLGQDFKYTTNLKWELQENSDNDLAKIRVQLYCQQTLWMIKNLLVLRGYSNQNIKIKYFYPESMAEPDQQLFKEAWEGAKELIFKNCGFSCENIDPEPESIVPFYSLLIQNNELYSNNLVNVDIGGGTTDIFFFDKQGIDKEQGFDTSVFFAANDLWGVTFPAGKQNGFVEYMESQVDKIIGHDDLKTLYKNFTDKEEKASLASFFFKHNGFNFGGKIKNRKEFLYLLFLHYSSIIYYIKDMIDDIRKKDPNVKFPKVLTFTGKGSEYIKLLTPEEKSITLLTQCLFAAFGVDKEELKGFHIQYPENPKTLTADGGVYRCQTDKTLEVSFKKTDGILDGFAEEDSNSKRVSTYQDISSDLLGFAKADSETITLRDMIDNVQEYKKRIMENFTHFISILFDDQLVRECTKRIGIDILPEYRQITIDEASKSLDLHYKRYCAERRGHEGDKLKDSLFFLTLKNTLISLSNIFYNKMKK